MTTPPPRPTTEPGRLDRELVRRGLATSRTRAQALITAGAVSVNGRRVRRPAEPVRDGDDIRATPDPYVSRAAYKLVGALDDLAVEVDCRRALDAGASTGGFTQVLLARGCREVIAVDVGHDQLDPGLRADPRVVVFEGTNLRDLTPAHVRQPVDLVVADVSFISLRLLIGPLIAVLADDGDLLVMIKPQFEVGRERLGRGGVVRSAELQRQAVAGVLEVADQLGWSRHDVVASRLPGASGNHEFFARIRRDR